MNWYLILLLLSYLAVVFVGAYALVSTTYLPVKRSFLALLVAYLGNITVAFVTALDIPLETAYAIVKWASPIWIFLGFFYVQLAYALAAQRIDFVWWGILVASVVASVYMLSTDDVFSEPFRQMGVIDFERDTLRHTLVSLPDLLGVVWGNYTLLRAIRYQQQVEEKRIFRALVSICVFAALFISFYDILVPNFFQTSGYIEIGDIVMAFGIVAAFVAIKKWSMLHVDVNFVSAGLFNQLNDGVIVADDAGRIRYVNGAAGQIFNRNERQRPFPPTVQELFVDAPEVQNGGWLRMDLGNGVKELEITRYTHHKDALLVFQLFLIRDETSKVEAHQTLRQIRDELEKEAQARSLRMRQAQKMEALASVSGGFVHDFNDILTAIMGNSQVMMDKADDDSPLKIDFQEVNEAAGRAADIVKQMMSFSEEMSGNLHHISLAKVVKDTLKLLEPELVSSITLKMELDYGVVVHADASKLHQMVLNLVTNAIKSMPDGGTLQIILKSTEVSVPREVVNTTLQPGIYAGLFISDTGCGIAAGNIHRVFEPFFTTRPKEKGTGIGLATVFKVIQEHHGGVDVRSELDNGTTFRVFLPVVDNGRVSTIPQQATSDARKVANRILLVEDNAAVARVIEKMLKILGLEVHVERRAGDALQYLRTATPLPDAMIVDYQLPDYDGVTLSDNLVQKGMAIPSILISGNFDSAVKSRAESTSIGVFLAKPVSKRQLSNAIDQVMTIGNGGLE